MPGTIATPDSQPAPATRRACLGWGVLLTLLIHATVAAAQPYQVGDAVADFPLNQRDTGITETFDSLSDFEGKIIFLEWFYYWCPYCQQAAIDIERDIVQRYQSENGNPAGIEVVHIAINLQTGADASTDAFIRNAGFHLVADDTAFAARNLFHNEGFPVFVIINGVKGSPSHRQWEVLYSENAYHSSADTTAFRQSIDAVQKPIAPAAADNVHRRQDGRFEMSIMGDVDRAYDIEVSTNLKDWAFLESVVITAGGTLWSDLSSPGEDRRFYRIVARPIAPD